MAVLNDNDIERYLVDIAEGTKGEMYVLEAEESSWSIDYCQIYLGIYLQI